MTVSIDASSNGSGGGKRHLIQIIENFDVGVFGFKKIIIWGTKNLLDDLPNKSCVIKKTHASLNFGSIGILFWQLFLRDKCLNFEYDIIFSPFGTYTGSLKPYVSMSQNMLYYDSKERARFGFSFLRFKTKILSLIQKKSFQKSNGIIFISNYAKNKIEKTLKLNYKLSSVINFGISDSFRKIPKIQKEISKYSIQNPFKLLYVSTVLPYKHQWILIHAVSNLRKKGFPLSLTLVGNGDSVSCSKVSNAIKIHDPKRKFIYWEKQVELNEINKFYHESDSFIFASTCENMPNILIEAMSSGLPILCSNYSPMSEFLKDGGEYFNPTSVKSTEKSILKFIKDHELRQNLCEKSHYYSNTYSWSKCSKNTFIFLNNILNNNKQIIKN